MVIQPTASSRDAVSFGPFNLDPRRRLLTKDGVPVVLGGRALDMLIALVSRPNQPISKRDLMAMVWPDVVVEEGSLRFHISALRKALGDGRDGARYITTLAARGYCFVAPVSRMHDLGNERANAVASFSHANLPARLGRMVGRDTDIAQLVAQLTVARFVSIVGSGGVGKTTVAVAVGHHLMEAFAGATLFVDLGTLSDPDLVPTATASMLGLSVQSDDATPSVIAYLRDKRVLLILDTCEHLIDAVARLAAQIFAAAPNVHILATSREAIQVDAEHVYRLDPLGCPPEDAGATATSIQEFPATQLFVERAMASGARLRLDDADAVLVGSICRKLDGVALAIELAARRVESYGLQQTANLLDQRLTLLWTGPRTATPRQRTLQATLDWSYGLLSDLERLVLRRLAVFVGYFTLDAALEVASNGTLDQSRVLAAMDSLVAKSMVVTRPIGAMVRYRLLDTTRAYALESAPDGGDLAELMTRHAGYYRRWLEQNGNEWSMLSSGTERAAHFSALNNVRAALEWCFGPTGNTAVGVSLAAAAVPVFLAMSLLPECHRWSEQGLLRLGEADRGTVTEMHLQACLGIASLYMHGHSDAARETLYKGLANAEARGDHANSVGLRGLLHMVHFRGGDFKASLENALQCRAIAGVVEDPAAAALAESILARSLHIVGEHAAARAAFEASLALTPRMRQRASTVYLGYDSNYRTEIALSRTLWLLGFPDQAAERAQRALDEAERLGRPESLAIIFAWASSIFVWRGDYDIAERTIGSCIAHAESQSLMSLVTLGRARLGEIAIRRGDARAAVDSLTAALEKVYATIQGMLTTELTISLVQGLTALGRQSEGIARIDRAIRTTEARGDTVYMAELLRVKAGLLADAEAEGLLRQSLDVTRRQGGRAWELRAATDLASRWNAQGRSSEARTLLRPVLDQFTEGQDTVDLRVARNLLATLG